MQDRLSIVILSAGDQTLPWFTEHLIPGSLEWLTLNNNYSKITRIANGFPHLFKKRDSITGLLMPEIGASQETGIGEIQFQFGLQKTSKNWFALDQLRSFRNCQDVEKLPIYTEKTLTISPFHQSKERES